MGHPRFNISVVIDTSAHANTILTNISNKLDTYTKFSVDHPPDRRTNELGEIEINADVRFRNSSDIADVISWIKSQIRDNPSVRDWILKARVTRHKCNHADGIQSVQCDQNDFVVEWEK